MTGVAAALSCPNCGKTFGELDWHDGHSGSCRSCGTDFEAMIFPEQSRQRRFAKPQAVAVAEDSTCFFHAGNQAETICEGCGRFLCVVCAVPLAKGRFCPSCIAGQKTAATVIPQRILFDSAALSLTLLPLLVWPLTFLTAPIALGLVVYGWNKPGSYIRGRSRGKQVLAGLLALAEMGAWAFVIVQLWVK